MGKTLAAVLLVGLGLSGLGMSLCGGFFSGLAVFEFATGRAHGQERGYDELFLFMGSGSFVFGLLAMFLTVVAWRKLVRR